ncbi:MAG: DUF6503 family protein [Bacteroidetes bacterium]|jgi:hypothetical protein|nr:DUF6503 family protein [Bacteroidota bacterium]MDF1863356.1 DUF6503 family protein [Saprospiraceae bacterium]
MKNLLTFLVFSSLFVSCEEKIIPALLLEKSIQYHDPRGVWDNSDLLLTLEQERPDTNVRDQNYIHINNKNDNFELTKLIPNGVILRGIQNGKCIQKHNGEAPSPEIVEQYRLTCERSEMFRNYYTYLYGLPMKLKDPGTILGDEVLEMSFQGKVYNTIRVTYEEAVGTDTWYFFFDKETSAMSGYKFYKDESKNDGEYIILEGEEVVNGIKIPKKRRWYYNNDDTYLGTDILVSGKSF